MKKFIALSIICFVANGSITAQKLLVNATPPPVLFETVTAGINEVNAESAVKIYPNPTTNELTIFSQDGYKLNSSELFIYDAAGKMVAHEKNIAFTDQAYKVNVSGFENGIYSLIINTKDRKAAVNKKFVISK